MREMIVLAGHRAEAADLPEEPLHYLGARTQTRRQELSGLLAEIDEDRARFEDAERGTAISRLRIDDRRHAIVGRDLEEIGLELLALLNIDGVDLVRDAGFFAKNGDLVAVRRRPIIEIDHGIPPPGIR